MGQQGGGTGREKNRNGSLSAGSGAHYYLFDVHDTVVKVTGKEEHWYRRDRISHTWIEDDAWSVFFYDLGFSTMEIHYDEEQERIVGKTDNPACSWGTGVPLPDFEKLNHMETDAGKNRSET
jgi:hypothetical protein